MFKHNMHVYVCTQVITQVILHLLLHDISYNKSKCRHNVLLLQQAAWIRML